MSDDHTLVLVLGFAVLLSGPILLMVFMRSRTHDPERARAFYETDPDGTFTLAFDVEVRSELFFRFDLEGGTDDDYDLVIRGEIEAKDGTKRAFGSCTQEKSRIDGADQTTWQSFTDVVDAVGGSIRLGEVTPGDRALRGRVDAEPKSRLRRSWVYIPK
jgi:hypothetical protein